MLILLYIVLKVNMINTCVSMRIVHLVFYGIQVVMDFAKVWTPGQARRVPRISWCAEMDEFASVEHVQTRQYLIKYLIHLEICV